MWSLRWFIELELVMFIKKMMISLKFYKSDDWAAPKFFNNILRYSKKLSLSLSMMLVLSEMRGVQFRYLMMVIICSILIPCSSPSYRISINNFTSRWSSFSSISPFKIWRAWVTSVMVLDSCFRISTSYFSWSIDFIVFLFILKVDWRCSFRICFLYYWTMICLFDPSIKLLIKLLPTKEVKYAWILSW